MTFSHQIRAARSRLQLTQKELAARLDVDKQSVSNWECGRSMPWPKDQAIIMARLRTRVIDRMGWDAVGD